MSTDPINPYAAPRAVVADETATLGEFIPGGKGTPAGNGWGWIVSGWGYFKESPGLWIGIIVVLFLMMMAMAVIPFIGSLATTLLTPVFLAGLMLGCRAIDEGRGLEFNHLFAGFQNRLGTLVAVGALYLAGFVALMVIVVAVVGVSAFGIAASGGVNQHPGMAGMMMVVGVLIGVALSIPLVMAIWFAPALVIFHDLGAVEAMKQSFTGCLRNIVPFLVYGLIGLVLMIFASLPLFLGWLVLGPVFAASVYAAYKDIYLA